MIERLNGIRAAAGLPSLVENAQLMQAAQAHVVDLASGRVVLANSHIGSDGSTVLIRAERAGYRAAEIHEMTGWGWGDWDAGDQVDYWLNSSQHRPIIFDLGVADVGWAYLRQAGAWTKHTSWWVVVVGRGVGAPTPERPASEHIVHD